MGRRIEIDETPAGGGSRVVSKYIWCGSKLCQARDASYAVTRSYLDEGEYKVGAANPSLYYGIDQIGSVRRVFESATNAQALDYDPWGVALQQTTALADFTFAGMLGSADTGLNLAWFRGYAPTVGRWMSRDPLGETATAFPESGNPVGLSLAQSQSSGIELRTSLISDTVFGNTAQVYPLRPEGLNVYNYVSANPISLTDYFGLQIIVSWGHGDRHVQDPDTARAEILQCLPDLSSIWGEFRGRTPSGLEYRGYPLPGRIHIGTYFPY